MQTQQIVRGAAEVLTITRLAVNDVYKRVVETSYSGEPHLRFGVVTDVMDNGPDAAVVALEFRPAEYGGTVILDTKIITGTQALAIYPATPDEVRQHMSTTLEAARGAEKTAREAWEKAAALTARVERVQDALFANALTVPATSTEALPEPQPETETEPTEPGF